MRRSYFFNFCTHLNQNICRKSLYFNYFYSKKNEFFCIFLRKNKLIYNYTIFSIFCSKTLKYILKLKLFMVFFGTKPIFRGLFFKRTKKSMITKKLHQIQNICKNRKNNLNPLFILDTNQGFLTHIDAARIKIGGLLLGNIYL